jgi:xanthine dehydrogenase YagS FAD-binding subunit
MQNFEYANPKTLKEATALLGASWDDAAVLAGGTDLLSLMKDYVMSPKRVVNIKNIPELKGIARTPQGLRIGAAATFDELINSPLLRGEFNALLDAVKGVSSPQIRNLGTAGGDLCQRPRCWYYRNGFGLLAQQGRTSMPAEGENKYHAIFGGGPAYFVSASSLGPPLIALGAKVRLVSAAGSREVDVAKFFVAPEKAGVREIAMLPNEILTEIVVPSVAGRRSATYEVRQKDALDWPLATASVTITGAGAAIKDVSIVLGHVAPTPWPVPDAAKQLVGKGVTQEWADFIAAAAVAGAQPLSDNGYKVQLAKVAVKRALLALAKPAPAAPPA